jgi:large subunit ribosomal protein L21
MYAVVRTGGRQYRVEAGTTLVVEKLAGEPGSSVTFDRVLLVGDGDTVLVGTPTVAGASVSATVLGQVLGEKIVVFKFKQKAKYRRRTGHRQQLTQLRIDEISAGGRTVRAEAAVSKPRAAKPKPAATRGRQGSKAPEAAADEPAKAEEPKVEEAAKPARTRSRAKAAAATEEASADAPRKPRARRTAKPADEKAAEE